MSIVKGSLKGIICVVTHESKNHIPVTQQISYLDLVNFNTSHIIILITNIHGKNHNLPHKPI